jgi:hypothetical protein
MYGFLFCLVILPHCQRSLLRLLAIVLSEWLNLAGDVQRRMLKDSSEPLRQAMAKFSRDVVSQYMKGV